MKRIVHGLALLVLALAAALPARAQAAAAPTAEEIMDKAAKAQYGEKYQGLTSYRAEGAFVVPAQGIRGKLTIQAKAPNRMYVRIEVPQLGVIEEGFDGTVAWARDPFSGLREKDGTELAQTRYTSEIWGDAEWRKRYKSVKLAGEKVVKDRKAWLIDLEVEGLPVLTQGFDQETFLTVWQRQTMEAPQGTFTAETIMSDFRALEGEAFGKLMMAFRSEMTSAMQVQEFVLEKVEPNVEIDDKIFAMPEEEATTPDPGDKEEGKGGDGK